MSLSFSTQWHNIKPVSVISAGQERLTSNSTLSFEFTKATIFRRSRHTSRTCTDAHSSREQFPTSNIRSWGLWKNSSRSGVCILDEGAATCACCFLGTSNEPRNI
jgi:hypothetical protein